MTPLVDRLFSVGGGAVDGEEQQRVVEDIADPGRYFVEAAFAYCARIYTICTEDGGGGGGVDRRHYYIAQGVRGLFKDVLLCGETFTPLPLRLGNDREGEGEGVDGCGGLYNGRNGNPTKEEEEEEEDLNNIKSTANDESCYPSTVHGPSGEDFDIVCPDCLLPFLKIGDWLIFDRMSAYTLSIAAKNSCLPIRHPHDRVEVNNNQQINNRRRHHNPSLTT